MRVHILLVSLIFGTISIAPVSHAADSPFHRRRRLKKIHRTVPVSQGQKESTVARDKRPVLSVPHFLTRRAAALGAILRADLEQRRGYLPDATRDLEMAAAFFSENPDIIYRLAELYFVQGKNQKALQTLRPLDKKSDTGLDNIHFLVGRILLENGAYDTALSRFRMVSSTAKEYPTSLYWSGVAYTRKGKDTIAIQLYRESIEKNPELINAYYDLGTTYIRMEKFKKAAEEFKNVLSLSPFNLSAHLSLAMIEEYLKNFPEAKKHYQAVWLIDQGQTIAPLKLAEISFGEKNDTRALLILDTAMKIQKGNFAFLYDVADLFSRYQYTDKSIELYRKILRKNPSDVKANIEIGTLYLREDKLKDSIYFFEKARTMDPGNMGLVISLGYLYFKTDQVVKTRKLLFSTVDKVVSPDSAGLRIPEISGKENEFKKQLINLLYYTGLLLEEKNAHVNALACFEKILLLDPQNAKALNYIGYSLIEKGRDLPRARTLIMKALEIEPNNGYFVDSLGWLQYKEGKMDDALHTLLHAQKLAGENDVILEHIGDVYYNKGSLKEALIHWKNSLKKNDKNSALKQKIKRVETELLH